MSYLQLLPSAEFVYSGGEGCIYDLFQHDKYFLNKTEAYHLNILLKGEPFQAEKSEK